jgi:hypothetical protein
MSLSWLAGEQLVESRFWQIFKSGLDWSALYLGGLCIVVGTHVVLGDGYDLVVGGILLIVVRRPLIPPLDINVFLFGADELDDDDPDEDRGYKDRSGDQGHNGGDRHILVAPQHGHSWGDKAARCCGIRAHVSRRCIREDAVFHEPNGTYRGRDEIDRIAGVIKVTHPDFRYQLLPRLR